MFKGEGSLRYMTRDLQRQQVMAKLLALGAQRVYAGLLAYALEKDWKPGWAAHSFKEIFGAWPRREDRVEPVALPDFLIEEWAAYRRKKPRIRLEKPAPLIDAVVAAPLPESELMTDADWQIDL